MVCNSSPAHKFKPSDGERWLRSLCLLFSLHSELCSEISPVLLSFWRPWTHFSQLWGLPSTTFIPLSSACYWERLSPPWQRGPTLLCEVSAWTWKGRLWFRGFVRLSMWFTSGAMWVLSSTSGAWRFLKPMAFWEDERVLQGTLVWERSARSGGPTAVQTNVPGLESSCQKSLCSLLSRLSSNWFPSGPSSWPVSVYCLPGEGKGL